MGTEVLSGQEVILNSIRYPIKGKVQPILTSKFAQKQVIGDYELDSDPDRSAWTINDQRGGILTEEKIRGVEDRCWWSTCNLGYKGHIVLPRLATAIAKPDKDQVPNIVNADMEIDGDATPATGGWDYSAGTVSRSATQKHGGTYSLLINPTGTDVLVNQYLTGWTPGVQYTVTCWLYSTGDTGAYVGLGDDSSTTWSNQQLTASWTAFTAQHTVTTTAKYLRIQLKATNSDTAYYDDASITMDDSSGAISYTALTPVAMENFNSKLYIALDDILTQLNTAGDTLETVYQPIDGVNITTLISSLNSSMYVFLGDDDQYWYVGTNFGGDGMTETDVADANLGVQWDNKLVKLNTTGEGDYATTPNAASPSWSTTGDITDLDANEVKNLLVYFDADGDDVVYATTVRGLKVLDLANTKWYDTALELGDHPNGGKGAIRWRDALYVSAGLNVQRYVAGVPAQITSMGLDEDDGMPAEYNGEIVKLLGKNNTALIALVDSSQSGGASSTSSVMAWDGKGWQCWWIGDSTEKAMTTGIISSAVGYKLYFDHNDTVYAINIPRGLENPRKLSTQDYATAGVHITPWFDADWQIGSKLALMLRVFCTGTTATEDIDVDYRIDHATTALAATWTSLGTIAAAGDGVDTEYTFGSSVGTAFKAIQFRFSLARTNATPATDKLKTPDLQYAILLYEKVIPPKWGWRFTVDCSARYPLEGVSYTPQQLLDNVITAAEVGTLVTFMYEDVTKYVRIKSVEGSRHTGEEYIGEYNIFVQEL